MQSQNQKQIGHKGTKAQSLQQKNSLCLGAFVAFSRVVSLTLCLALCACSASAGRMANLNSPSPQSVSQAAPQAQPASEKKPRATVDPNKFALIIAGVGGEEVYTKKFTAEANQLYDALTNRLGFDEKNVYLLTETAGTPAEGAHDANLPHTARATADEVRKAFAAFKTSANPSSLVFVMLIGHGSFDTQQAKFNLVGPDLTAKDYAQLFSTLPTKRVIFINSASSSGEFIKPLSGEGRIVITATRSGNEQNATVFAEYFIAGLADDAADADKNGRISVLEAYAYASKLTADWYKQKNRLATEHGLIDDNGDGTGHEEATAGDGTLAKTMYLDSKPLAQAGGDTELARLLGERQRLEEAVEKLKARKAELKPEEYDRQLEDLLVELAKVNQTIKTKQK
jgi:Peptidase C13 family